MGRIVEIRDHDREKNRTKRVITKDASCYYKMRGLLLLQILSAHLMQNENLYYKKKQV